MKKFADFPILKIDKSEFQKYGLFKRFLEISDPPKEIYIRGNIEQFKNPADFHFLSVIGSRAITNYGRDTIGKLVEPLLGQPICIISGLAIGVDGLSHKAAMKAVLPMIVVPGSGLGEKVLYPATNRELALEILNKGGLMISEYEENFKSTLWAFPARNRLMAALSDAVLIIEARERSGTMITARLALEYNKDVWCVPGSIFSETSVGTNELIQNGAALIKDTNDILHGFRIQIPGLIPNPSPMEKGVSANLEKYNLSPDEKMLLEKLTENLSKDKLFEISKLEFGDFFSALTMLEMKNCIKIDGGIVRKIV